jgi:hypothetical protein
MYTSGNQRGYRCHRETVVRLALQEKLVSVINKHEGQLFIYFVVHLTTPITQAYSVE